MLRLRHPAPAIVTRYMLPDDRRPGGPVVAIEAASSPRPLGREGLERLCAGPAVLGQVAVLGGDLAGFVVYSSVPARFIIHVLAVRPECRRRGVGRRLVGLLVDRMGDAGKARTEALVPERAVAAQLLFRALGFRWTRTAAGHGREPGEDGYVFVCPRGGWERTP